MKTTVGQKLFASSVSTALTRAWSEGLALFVRVDPSTGESRAELADPAGRVVWSQTADAPGSQLALPLARAPQETPAPRAPAAPESALVLVECPADRSMHPLGWAEELNVDRFGQGRVAWQYSRPADTEPEDAPATAWTVVPRAIGTQIVERLAESATPTTVKDGAEGEVMLLEVGGVVRVGGDAWRAVLLGADRTLLERDGETRDVASRDVRWLNGWFCVDVQRKPAPKPKKAPRAKAPPHPPTRLWIAEAAWDGLSQDERDALAELPGGLAVNWQGTEGFVFADLHSVGASSIRRLADELGVSVAEGAEAPKPKKPAKPAKGRGKHMHEAVPEADTLAERGKSTLARQGPERWEVVAVRGAESGPEWRALALGAQRHGRVRVYDRKPRCTWDSMDEGKE